MARGYEDAGDRPSLVALLEHYYDYVVPATRKQVKINCPLPIHDDRNASASIDTERQLFKCFGCDSAFDSWGLIMEEEACDFSAAKQWAEEHGFTSGSEVSGRTAGVTGGVGLLGLGARPQRGNNRQRQPRLRRKRRA